MTSPLAPHLHCGNIVETDLYRLLAFSDVHFPFVEPGAVRCLLKYMCLYNPHEVLILGDLVDFYAASKYTKDPRRATTLQDDLDQAVEFLKRLRQLVPAAKIVMIEGNHEHRMHKDLCRKAHEYRHLRALDLKTLLFCNEIGIHWVPEDQFYRVGPLCFTHGESVSKFSAAWHLAEYGANVVLGHTHRLQCRHHRTLDKMLTAWEVGCMCSFEVAVEYKKHPNWQRGFLTIDWWQKGRRTWAQGHLIDGSATPYNGSIISGLNP